MADETLTLTIGTEDGDDHFSRREPGNYGGRYAPVPAEGPEQRFHEMACAAQPALFELQGGRLVVDLPERGIELVA